MNQFGSTWAMIRKIRIHKGKTLLAFWNLGFVVGSGLSGTKFRVWYRHLSYVVVSLTQHGS